MKIKKHLVAATLAVGLVGSAGAMGPSDDSVNAQAGYLVVKYAFNNNPAGQSFAQGFGGTLGAGLTGLAGAKIGAKFGAKVGAIFGGIGGMAIGAGVGAL